MINNANNHKRKNPTVATGTRRVAAKQQQQALLTSFLSSSANDDKKLNNRNTTTNNKRPRSRSRSHDGSSFGNCPLCSASFPLHKLETHAAACDGTNLRKKSKTNNNARQMDSAGCNDDTTTTTTDRRTGSILMNHAFSEPIPGLFLFEDFITPEEEEQIIEQLDDGGDQKDDFVPWKRSTFNGTHIGKRWGVHCNLRDRKVNAAEHPMPSFYHTTILPKLKELRQPKAMMGCIPNEANAIDYRRKDGHYLKPHVDDRQLSKEPIANLSLAGDCYMTFRNVAPNRNTAIATKRILLKRRTLQILTGKARYDFSHGIDNADLLSDRRISVTMRESPLTTKTTKMTPAEAVPATVKKKQPHAAGVVVAEPVATDKPWWLKKKKSPQDSTTSLTNEIKPSSMPIPGLFIFEGFITENEEKEILREMDGEDDLETSSPHYHRQPWKVERHSGLHKEKRFGVDHDLWSQDVRPPKHEMPKFFCRLLLPKLRCVSAMMGCTPNDANAISYYRKIGHSLKAHVDDRKKHKEPIANLSLAGDCYMTFRNQQKHRPNLAVPVKKVLLKRRCLQVMTGKARYDYSHGIDNADLLSDRRVSLTMRETVTPY